MTEINGPISFETVLNDEREQIQYEAGKAVGLAFSGGGIRSATFNLGVLQALSELKLLHRFDYLSTVSGGGYIGGWLSSLLYGNREKNDAKNNIDTDTNININNNNNFDTLSKKAATRIGEIETLLAPGNDSIPKQAESDAINFLRQYSNYLTPKAGAFSADTWTGIATYLRNLLLNQIIIVSSLCVVLLVPRLLAMLGVAIFGNPALSWTVQILLFAVVAIVTVVAIGICITAKETHAPTRKQWAPAVALIFLLLTAYFGSFLLWSGLRTEANAGKLTPAVWHITAWGIPALMSVVGAAIVLIVGIAGRRLPEPMREWWSRFGGWMMILMILWLGLCGIGIFGPYLIKLLMPFGYWLHSLGFAWLATTITGLLAARGPSTGKPDDKSRLDIIVKIAPYVFAAGLLFIISYALHEGLAWFRGVAGCAWDAGYFEVLTAGTENALCALIIFTVIAAVFSWAVDINLFSLHMFYRNRLVRCYLGATNPDRKPHPFTGFDEHDNIDLKKMAGQRPYHLVNTALNLTTGSNLAWQERKAASFVMSPLYCGYKLDHSAIGTYQKTEQYALDSYHKTPISIGGAVSISGAAASPNQGFHSSLPVAFLMTTFNVRLGWWMPNPRFSNTWAKASTTFGFRYLIQELFGMSDDKSDHVYLSDGGHFENLAIYELVRRKCRFIVVSDAGQDSKFQFQDLGNAVRKCYVDFGVRIDIDTTGIHPQPDSGFCKFHCAVGSIRYDLADATALPGVLLYFKPSLTGNEPADILHYAAEHKTFPHQTTADQWFDESQFESYRKLGYHIATTILKPATTLAGQFPGNEDLFSTLRQRWYPPSGKTLESFSKRSAELERILSAIRTTPALHFLDQQIYAEYRKIPRDGKPPAPEYWVPETEPELREAFYVCNNMIQLMENVYLELDLEQYWEHPDNRGWMNLYTRWSWSGMFNITWAICAGVYGARFQGFCERRLGLNGGKIALTSRSISWTNMADFENDVKKCRTDTVVNFIEAKLLLQIAKTWCTPEQNSTNMQVVQTANAKQRLPKFTVYGFNMHVEQLYPGASKLQDAHFPFGFAVVQEGNNPGEAGHLVFFRVRDHVRKLGLARKALKHLFDNVPNLARDTVDLVMLDADEADPDPAAARRRFIRLLASVP